MLPPHEQVGTLTLAGTGTGPTRPPRTSPPPGAVPAEPMAQSFVRDARVQRVLLVNTEHTGGGAGRVSELLARELRSAGYAVAAMARTPGNGDPHVHVATHWRLGGLQRWLRAAGWAEWGNVAALLWRYHAAFAGADVVHLHNLHGEYLSLAALPLWGRDKPLVWTLHDMWALTGNCAVPHTCARWRQTCGHCPRLGVYPQTHVDRSRLHRWLKPRLFAAAHVRLVTPSHWLAERVRAVPQLARLPLHVVPNPVDCETFRPAQQRAALRQRFGLAGQLPTVVLVGNDWRDALKGGSDAVVALRIAASATRHVQVLVIGAHGDELLAQARVPGRALPVLTDRAALAAAYACADVCLFPSRAENYPLTVLEALACGTPVVAYAVGGIPEQVQAGQSGHLAPNERPTALGAALAKALHHAPACAALGRHGRRFVEETCAADRVARAYAAEYERALAAWRRRRARDSARRPTGPLARGITRMLGWTSSTSLAAFPREGRAEGATPDSPATAQSNPHSGKPRSQRPGRAGSACVPTPATPLISVITPSFNQGAFIERCIQSVLAQHYPRFEHIICDNCSTDETAAVVARYPHVRFYRERDNGQSQALNRALRRARGEIIAWINADDYYLPGAFAVAQRHLDARTHIFAIAGRVQLVDPEGRVQQVVAPRFLGRDYLADFWSHSYGLCQPGVLFRREVVEQIGLLRENLHYAMDYDYWLRLARRFDVRIVDATIAGYIVHPASKTGRDPFNVRFNLELARVASAHWGPWWQPRRWWRAWSCNQFLGYMLRHHLVAAAKRRDFDRHDRRLALQLLLRTPWNVLRRPVAGAIVALCAARTGRTPADAKAAGAAPGNRPADARAVSSAPGPFGSAPAEDSLPTQEPSAGPLPAAPAVSVIIPTYNRAALLRRAIDSARGQALAMPFEIIVVDDGSTDATPIVLSGYGDQVRVLRRANGGAAAARNAALRAARGAFVAFLDSDDEWAPDHLARALAALNAHPQALFAATDGQMVEPDGRAWSPARPPALPTGTPVDLAPHLVERVFLLTPCVVARRMAVLRAGGFDERTPRGEDYLLWLRLALAGPAILLDAATVTCTAGAPHSLTADPRRVLHDELRVRYLMRPLLRRRPDCIAAWDRALGTLLGTLRDKAHASGNHANVIRFGLRKLLWAPGSSARWEWGRVGYALAALAGFGP